MYSFRNDYSESAHPNILKALVETNMSQLLGYGMDEHTQAAIKYMKEKMQAKNVDIHFVSGGTQANLLATAGFLRPFDAVICTNSAHIHTHEAGSVEATGHKVLVEYAEDGKLTPAMVEHAIKVNSAEETPNPKMVYISNATELGTIHTKKELEELYECCKKYGMYFFIDGARIGSALAWKNAGTTLADYPKLCDAFYIGGTKNGALLGEAIVIVNDELKANFRRNMKQRGAILAKGKVTGIQFEELFKGNLYMELAEHANAMADKLREGIKECAYPFLVETPSNQMFPIFPNEVLEKLNEEFVIPEWEVEIDDANTCVRIVTSWATEEAQVDRFVALLKSL